MFQRRHPIQSKRITPNKKGRKGVTGLIGAGGGMSSRGPALLEELEKRRLLASVPQFDHVVMVIEENRAYSDIIGSGSAPYINSLAQNGANFTHSQAVVHPSTPNYLALFSGSTQGVNDD